MEMIDKAIEIISRTNDGDDLDGKHLWLVQEAVNGNLNERGWAAFEELYEQVISPEGYKRPWLQGVEHLTKDTEGFVFWKGKQVEHYSYKSNEEEKQAATELARRCKIVEERGQEVNAVSVIWKWKE